MLINGIAKQLIEFIPDILGGDGIIPSKEEVLRVVEIPSSGFIINFNDDVWDARKGFAKSRRSQNRIRFDKCNEQARFYVKLYAANEIDNGTKISTLHTTIRLLYKVLNRAIELNYRTNFLFITTHNVTDAINEIYAQSIYDKRMAYVLLIRFLEFMAHDVNMKFNINLVTLNEEKIIIDKEIDKYRNHAHIPDIPDELFDILINKFDDVMRDDEAPLNDRMIAGMLLLDTQLGLRVSEIPALETDCKDEYLCDDGVTRPFITYNSIKAARGDVEALPVKTFCNDIASETVDYLLELRKNCRYANDTDFLLVLEPRGGSSDGDFPVDSNTFSDLAKMLMAKYLRDELRKDWKGIKKVKERAKKDAEYLSIPTLHSFRKHFARVHSTAETPLDYIDCAMSHSPQSDDWDDYNMEEPPKQAVFEQHDMFTEYMKKIIDGDEE